MNKPYRIILAFHNLVVKNKHGRDVDLKRGGGGGLITFLPLKKGGLIREGEGVI